ncbi:hypothetical protein DSECCO2_583860 [anaerobic digester metagenome]
MQRLEKVAVHVDPGAHVDRRPAQGLAHLARQGVHGVHVRDLELDARDDVALETQQFLGRGNGDVGQGGIVFVHAGLEETAHGKGFELGREPGRALLARGRHEVERVAEREPQAVGEFPADDDAREDSGGIQVVQAPGGHFAGQRQHLARRSGIDAAQHHALDPARARQHDFRVHEGRGPEHAGHGFGLGHVGPVVVDRPAGHGRHHMGVDAENLVAKFGGKALHDPHHHDQRRDAKPHPEHGDERNDRDEGLLLAGQEVAFGDEVFEAHEPGAPSGRNSGNRITSRMEAWSVSSMTSLSMPMPSPAAGGMPYSRART